MKALKNLLQPLFFPQHANQRDKSNLRSELTGYKHMLKAKNMDVNLVS